jgi:HAD superfamily hydrolase (TIGR01509 family)
MVSKYDVDEEIVKVIKSVKEKGLKTAICTSNFPARINGLQKRFGFLDNFDVKVISYEVGFNKPYREIFEKLVELSGVNAEEIVFADDNEESVESSKSVGITTLFYEGFAQYLEQLKAVGVNL